jgi:hypothetical protein
MANFIRRKKKIPSLEALNIDTSDIHIRGARTYGCWHSRTRKPFVLGGGVDLGDLPARKPKNKTGPKPGWKIGCKTESGRVKQAKPKPPPKPPPKPKKVRKTPLSKLEKPGRESKAYKPSQEEIKQVSHTITELNRKRVKAILDTREEEY